MRTGIDESSNCRGSFYCASQSRDCVTVTSDQPRRTSPRSMACGAHYSIQDGGRGCLGRMACSCCSSAWIWSLWSRCFKIRQREPSRSFDLQLDSRRGLFSSASNCCLCRGEDDSSPITEVKANTELIRINTTLTNDLWLFPLSQLT